jgi:hypothetical protein
MNDGLPSPPISSVIPIISPPFCVFLTCALAVSILVLKYYRGKFVALRLYCYRGMFVAKIKIQKHNGLPSLTTVSPNYF